ncbi:MAG TPA: methyltransferase domain-containing protein [Streptosporangiaceae bacterium]|jgi:SAM-dependent methyltransferase|nr:methyltransferase domain-containing protein [Streptosporangiaceae bacterium]
MTEADDERCLSPVSYDVELQRHNEILRRACDIQIEDHVLDIGCGTGQTTREAARTARLGSAFGIDVSASAIERAGELAHAERLRNVTFERADAQVYRFSQEHFDLAISRFGTMFFDDPVAAFANIGRSLRPTGRLVMMVWQSHALNEWDVVIHQSLGAVEEPMALPAGTPDPFSLAEPSVVTEILEAAQFVDIAFTDVREPVYYGPDVASAVDWVRGFTCSREVLKQLDPAGVVRTVERLREALAAHLSDDGVWFNSRTWIVTGRRR